MRAAPRVYAFSCAVAIAAYPFLPEGVRPAVFGIVGIASAVAVLSGLRHPGLGRRGPWVFLLVTTAAFVAVRAASRAYGLLLDDPLPLPSAPDFAILLVYALTITSGAVMSRSGRRESDADVALDSCIVATGAGILVWAFVFVPLTNASGLSLLGVLVLVALPVVDLAAVIATVRLTLNDRALSLRIVAAGWSLFLVVDLGPAVAIGRPAGAAATALDVLALAGFVAFGLMSPTMPHDESVRSAQPRAALPARRLLLLGTALLVAPFAQLVIEVSERHWPEVVIAAGTVAIAGLVILRMRLDRRRTDLAERAVRLSEERLRSLVEHVSDVILVVDETATVVYASPSAERGLGLQPEDWLGRNATEIVHPEDLSMVRAGMAATLHDPDDEGSVEVRVRDRRGEWRWVEARYTNRLRDPSVGGIVVSMRDMTERRAIDAALREREAQYHSFFEGNEAVMLLIDTASGAIVDANSAAADFYGYPRERMVLMRIDELREDDQETVFGEMRRASEEQRRYFVLRDRLASGEVRDVEVYAGSIAIAGRHLLYEIVHDITERRRVEEALRASQDRYRSLVEQLPAITFIDRIEGDPPDDVVVPEYISPQVHEILGFTPEEFLQSSGRWVEALHPQDRDAVLRKGKIADAAGGPYADEYRMIRKDGRVVWIKEHAVMLRDGRGRPAAWQGIMQDVTTEKWAEEALRSSERRFRGIFDGAAVGIARVQLDGRILEANAALAELFGLGRRELIDANLAEIAVSSTPGVLPEEFARLANGGIDRYEVDRSYELRGGLRVWAHVVVSLIRDGDGDPDFAIVMVEDVSARKAAEDELAYRAMHDPLTGLPNRSLMLDRLGMALARVGRGGQGLAVLFLDLDGFKDVNDEHGHDAGDLVLVEVARRLEASLRPADTLARYGGDEFVVLCESAWTLPDVIGTAERLSRSLRKPFAISEGVTATVGVSVGVTLAADASREGEELIRAADTAMYRAKQEGRGGVAIFDQGEALAMGATT